MAYLRKGLSASPSQTGPPASTGSRWTRSRTPTSPNSALNDFALEIIINFGNVRAQVIESFSCKETSEVFLGESSRKIPGDIQPRALMKLRQIHRIVSIDNLT
jgi:hypothetical protein